MEKKNPGKNPTVNLPLGFPHENRRENEKNCENGEEDGTTNRDFEAVETQHAFEPKHAMRTRVESRSR